MNILDRLALLVCAITSMLTQSTYADDYVQDDAFDTVNTYRHGNFRARQTMEVSQQEDPPDYNLDYIDEDTEELSEWTEWSFCSRSCGGGVAMRTRDCGMNSWDSLEGCGGNNVQHKICNTEHCPGESDDYRATQCAMHNERPVFQSQNFEWAPYYGDNQRPCELICTAIGFYFYKTFGPVQDGTRCYEDRYDMCIEGNCMKVGCDRILGSNLTEDACGVCGGNNTTCRHFKNIYDRVPPNLVKFDYNEVAMIPKGATHIQVKDTTNNYLALMEATGSYIRYIINGNWVISWPGEFIAAGTVIKYERTEDYESFTAAGPTTTDLHVMMLFLDDVPRIEYEFWMPNSKPLEQEEYQLPLGALKIITNQDEEYYQNVDLVEPSDEEYKTTTSTETISTTTLATTTTTQAPYSPTTAPYTTTTTTTRRLPAQHFNSRTNKRGKGKHNKQVKNDEKDNKNKKPDYCSPCQKPADRKQHYCDSDFVAHVQILSKYKLEGRRYRHDVKIIYVYKSDFKMMSREYIWVYSSCCPRFRPDREYIIMGRKRRVEMPEDTSPSKRATWVDVIGDKSAKKSNQQTRLVVDHFDYWRIWKRKYHGSMMRVANKAKCKKSTPMRGILRDPEAR